MPEKRREKEGKGERRRKGRESVCMRGEERRSYDKRRDEKRGEEKREVENEEGVKESK